MTIFSTKNLSNTIIIIILLIVLTASTTLRFYFRMQERKYIAEHTTQDQFYNYLIIRSVTGVFIICILGYIYYITNKK